MTAFLNDFKSGPALGSQDPNYVENLIKYGQASSGNAGNAVGGIH